tara:strand:- start:1481 stop:3070 length:1590 start_codon:yes stop_codon:yes gene_type:complete
MEHLKDIHDFLTEKKVTVKRRYTESHPAKNVSTSARVRTSILEAIADGQITEAEMTRILKELKAHKRWLNRNKPLFNVSEDQGGIKTFSLSPYGKRVMNATKTTVINEALTVPHKEKGKKPVNIFVGRFQPFTLGHVKVFQKMHKENGYPVVVYLVRGGKPDPEKRPFDEDLQQAMFAKMQKQYPFLEASYVVPNGAIDTLYSAARPAYEPMMWGYGTDRKKAYNGMIDKQDYRDQLGVHPDFKGFEIKRGDENISASKVRNALKIDDEKTFKQMTPKSIHSFYKPLQTIMQPIKENNNMKNLKSLNEFATIESVEINEGVPRADKALKDLEKQGSEIDYLDDANAATKKIWKNAGVNPDDENTIILYSYANGAWPETKKILKKHSVDFKELEDPNSAGESFIVFVNESVNEGAKETAKEIFDELLDVNGKEIADMDKRECLIMLKRRGITGSEAIKVCKEILKMTGSIKESVNEEYTELMPEIANALGTIQSDWERWKNGPMTEPSDIKPAAKELKGWITRWMKQNIK